MAQQSNYPEYSIEDYRIPGVQYASPNKNLRNVGQAQLDLAKDFRSKIPQYGDELYGNYAKGAKQDLASNIAKTRAGFNSRGLLNSGQRQGSELGLQANSFADLAQKRSEINRGLLDTADSLENNAFNTAGNEAGLGPGLGGSALAGIEGSINNSIAQNQANSSIYGGIAQGLGGIGGALAYRKSGK